MQDDFQTKLMKLIEDSFNISYIKPEEIPNIDLYMDQVTTFMDEYLKASKRNDDDKILTKTMINNYTKNDLLPPSNKKKYSSEHLILLIYIYYYKNVLSINDIQKLLEPIINQFYTADKSHKETPLQKIYQELINLQDTQMDTLKASVDSAYKNASSAFSHMDSENKDFLTLFAFTSLIGFDAYMKIQLIENIIDGFLQPSD